MTIKRGRILLRSYVFENDCNGKRTIFGKTPLVVGSVFAMRHGLGQPRTDSERGKGDVGTRVSTVGWRGTNLFRYTVLYMYKTSQSCRGARMPSHEEIPSNHCPAIVVQNYFHNTTRIHVYSEIGNWVVVVAVRRRYDGRRRPPDPELKPSRRSSVSDSSSTS
jgi:hypothetical protein